MENITIRNTKGAPMTCKGWTQEAALRMLNNNLDPDVAEDPTHLIVYGGSGKAARNWECYHAIVRSLKTSKMTKPCWCSRANRSAFSARMNMPRAC